MKGYQTAEQVVNEALAMVRDFDRVYYNEAALYFIRGFREFRLFKSTGQVKESWEIVTPIDTVNYPQDLIRLVEAGVVIDGEFFSFTKSDDLVNLISDPLDLTLDEDRDEGETINRSPSVGYNAKANNLEYYYKVDNERRRIKLSRMALDTTLYADKDEVLLRYISSGIDDLKNTYVPGDAVNMLTSYIAYNICFSRPDKYDKGYIMMRKEDLREERNRYDTLRLPSLQELEDMIYETSGQIVRRI